MNPEKGEILCFNKPYRWTSFDLVYKVRGKLKHHIGAPRLKVGHAGTLDPLATGVMIICTGKATKLIDQLQAHTKEYVATLKLGATTPSFDRETEEDNTYPTSHLTPTQILDITQDIERQLGRNQKSTNGIYHDRTIDIDILLYDDLHIKSPRLTIPHPRMTHRTFVMQPLSQIAPNLIIPGETQTTTQLLTQLNTTH